MITSMMTAQIVLMTTSRPTFLHTTMSLRFQTVSASVPGIMETKVTRYI